MRTTSFRNIGSTERVLRLLLGLALIVVAIVVPGAWWGWFGVIPLTTAVVGWCPLYSLLGISTAKKVVR